MTDIQTSLPDDAAQAPLKNTRRAAIGAAVGSAIEWYDYSLYGAAAALIFNHQFFGTGSQVGGLLAAFATFAVGYLARPLGGIFFGHLGDKVGRKPVMVLTLVLMGLSTTLVGFLPTYATVGAVAPVLLISLRILQGLGAGAEYAGAVTLSSESAPARHRGWYASWSPAGVWIGSAIGLFAFRVSLSLTGDKFEVWGWRIPFLVSALLLVVAFLIREHVQETKAFEEVKKAREEGTTQDNVPLVSLLRSEKRRLFTALGTNFILTGYSYISQTWILSYLTNDIKMAAGISLVIQAVLLTVGAVTVLCFGRVSDTFGRRRLFLWAAGLGVLWPFPVFAIIDLRNPVLTTLALLVCFAGSVAATYAAQAAMLPELFPSALRYSGIAFAREVSGALLGGTTPLIATALLAWAGHWWPVATWMVVMATVAFACAWYSKKFRRDDEQWNDASFLNGGVEASKEVG